MHEAIAAAGGDLQMALRSLLYANALLEAELDRVRAQLSRGFVRGRFDRDQGRR